MDLFNDSLYNALDDLYRFIARIKIDGVVSPQVITTKLQKKPLNYLIVVLTVESQSQIRSFVLETNDDNTNYKLYFEIKLIKKRE